MKKVSKEKPNNNLGKLLKKRKWFYGWSMRKPV